MIVSSLTLTACSQEHCETGFSSRGSVPVFKLPIKFRLELGVVV